MSSYSTFRTNVRNLLTVDKDRLGISETDGFIDKMLRQAMIEVQTYVPLYQTGQQTVFATSDFTTEGDASVADLPEEAKITSISIATTGEVCERQELDVVDWACRFSLICGDGCCYAVSIDPQAKRFYISPEVTDDVQITMYWNGLKLDYDPTDAVPFDETSEMVVADYVTAKIERRVNKDLVMHESYMKSYYQGMWKLLTRARDRVRVNNGDANDCADNASCQPWLSCASSSSSSSGSGSADEVYDTYAELRAETDYTADMVAFALGATVKGDGGEGPFYFNAASAASDDGGTVLKPDDIAVADAGRWLRIST